MPGFDITRDRRLIFADFEGRPGRTVLVTVVLGHDLQAVWDALTLSARLDCWAGTTTGRLNLGGHYAIADTASGRIRICEAPTHLQVDWDYGDGHSVVDARLELEGTTTLLTLANSMPDESDGEWELYGPGSAGVGWEMMLVALDQHLTTGASFDDEAWVATGVGQATIRRWATAWGELHTASGVDPNVALRGVERTTAFYTNA